MPSVVSACSRAVYAPARRNRGRLAGFDDQRSEHVAGGRPPSYQVYPQLRRRQRRRRRRHRFRSAFAAAHLRHSASTRWINPWYPSPMADAGYDVADYRDIEPCYGTWRRQRAYRRRTRPGSRSCSTSSPTTPGSARLVPGALAGEPGARERYWFRPGRGADGEPAAERLAERVSAAPPGPRLADGSWYLHLRAGAARRQLGAPDVRRRVREGARILVRQRRRRFPGSTSRTGW